MHIHQGVLTKMKEHEAEKEEEAEKETKRRCMMEGSGERRREKKARGGTGLAS